MRGYRFVAISRFGVDGAYVNLAFNDDGEAFAAAAVGLAAGCKVDIWSKGRRLGTVQGEEAAAYWAEPNHYDAPLALPAAE